LGEADRRRGENYRAGLVVQFHQNVQGIRRGELFRVKGHDDKGGVIAVNDAGREIALPLKDGARFQVYEQREINLARGDRIRITRNGKSADGRRLNNGNVFTVEKFSRDGKIVLDTGAVLDATHGHLAYGYCQTSHSSQSKSVRDVLVAQSAESFSLASSREQFYVSVSRGKESIRIYTDNRQGLQEAVGNSSLRRSGVELAGFTAKDVSSLMREGPGSRQWRDMVQSRNDGAVKNHVQNLLRERKQEVVGKAANMDFREFVKMKRALAGPDGKSRSKGYSGGGPTKTGDIQNRGRSFIRPTQPKVPHKAANENKKPVAEETRQGRVAKGFQTAKNHFKKVTERVKGAAQKVKQGRSNQLPKNNAEQISKHTVKQRAADAGMKAKAQAKVQQKAPTPTPKQGR
jgi:hypothetical protein